MKLAGSRVVVPNLADVDQAIDRAALGQRDEVLRLRNCRKALTPVFLHTRQVEGSPRERLQKAAEQIQRRLEDIENLERSTTEELDRDWPGRARDLAPGGKVLEAVAHEFGVTFSKENGDSVRLASHMAEGAIAKELKEFLWSLGATEERRQLRH